MPRRFGLIVCREKRFAARSIMWLSFRNMAYRTRAIRTADCATKTTTSRRSSWWRSITSRSTPARRIRAPTRILASLWSASRGCRASSRTITISASTWSGVPSSRSSEWTAQGNSCIVVAEIAIYGGTCFLVHFYCSYRLLNSTAFQLAYLLFRDILLFIPLTWTGFQLV